MSGKIEISRELVEVIEKFISSQADAFPLISVPRGNRSDGLDGISKELRALLAAPVVEPLVVHLTGPKEWLDSHRAAPVVERQEPAGWQRKSRHEDGRWFYLPDDDVEEAIRLGYEVRKLYTSPPAPVAVVLPDRKHITLTGSMNDLRETDRRHGWNACLDKIKELNQ